MISSYQTQYEQQFEKNFSVEWGMQTLQALCSAYEEARAHCSSRFGDTGSCDLMSHYCREVFEHEWQKLSSEFPGMRAERKLNKRGTYSHTLISSGNMALTASSVPTPRSNPRYADFRSQYAANGQLSFFDEMESDPNIIYATLLFPPPKALVPAFVIVGFPTNDGRSYVERLNFLAMYSPTVESREVTDQEFPLHHAPVEEIPAPEMPRIRPRPQIAEAKELL